MSDSDQQTQTRRFTPDELKEFDGKEGRPAYVAYSGKVYDVTKSRLWRNGTHVRAHSAGEDLSSAMMAAPHDDDVMEGFEVVGVVFEDEGEDALERKPWPVQFSLDHHLHPIAVHFPTALGATAPLFALASLLFMGSNPLMAAGLQAASFWALVVCLLGSIPSVITGWISWHYNYAGVWTPIYRVKWGGSILLLVLCAGALTLKVFALGGWSGEFPLSLLGWVYIGLLVIVAATVAVLGHYGGKITFPS